MDTSTPRFAERLSAVIGLIYDTADDESLWPQLLEGMADLLVVPHDDAQAALGAAPELALSEGGPVAIPTATSEAEQYLWACLAPHFARSQHMHAELREAEMERDLLERVMDRLPLGMAIVNAQGRTISANRAMLALAQSGAGLALQSGHLVSTPPEVLANAIARVLDRQQDHACFRLEQAGRAPSAPSEAATPAQAEQGLSIWVSRLGQVAGQSRAMVLAASPGSRALSEDGLCAFFSLSPAEARLTQQLALGQSMEDAATALGISHNTAKTQLKKVFAKVGVKRQPELLQAIYASPLWLDMGPQNRRLQPRRAALQAALANDCALPEGSGMRLPDGRWMAWSDSGDPQGWPVLLCHGFVGSCHLRHPDDSHLRALGLRLIIPERPGCGHSDHLPGRSIGDWPADIAHLLCHLGIDAFGVISWQFGAPYALELARSMPQRVQALSLVSPPAPVSGVKDLRHYSGDGAFLIGVAFYTPRLLLPTLHAVVSAVRKNVFRIIDNELRDEPASTVINDPQFRARRAQTLQQATQNGAQCAEAEVMAIYRTWKTDYPSWSLPTTVWHGEADPQVHWHAGQRVAAMVPGAALRLVPGAGHFLLFSHWKEILGALRDSARQTSRADLASCV
ncbi:MAG: alpha/beta fold hydrolase [Rhodoferax sp.]|nr:alpha/beta fold hydrolase [Rhodoferax sp.]